jgi:photosystem II stability/assembly factor-like uncharacterized protein
MKTRILASAFFFFLFSNFNLFSQIPAEWNSRGIGGGGALYAPSINPADHNEIYMGCDMSELFHTTDLGKTWKEVSFLEIQGGHDACVQFTSDPMVRYCVDFTSSGGNDMIRPARSTDGGVTWSILEGSPYPPNPNGNILRLFVDYNNPQRIVIADYGTIFFSSDGGTTFHQVHTCLSIGSGNHIGGVFFDGENIYIGTNDGLLVSGNGGQTFTTMTVSGIPSGEYILSFAGARQGDTMRFYCLTAANVWAGYQYGSDYWNVVKGVYHMDQAGGAWMSQMSGISAGSDFPVFVGMASDDPSVAWLGGGSAASSPIVMKSVDGGVWNHTFLTVGNQNISTGWAGDGGDHGWSFPEAPFGFTVAPNDAGTVMFTDYSCAHITTDGGSTWHQQYLSAADENPMNASTPKEKKYHGIGLENTSCWQLLWTDSLNLFAAFSDINGIMSSDKGESWKFIPGLTQNTVYRIVKHPSGNLYACTSNIHDLYQSTRIYDAQIDNGTGAVWYSTDQGGSFTLLHNFGHPVVWIATDPTDPERMYASVLHHNSQAAGGIWVTDNLSAGPASLWSRMASPPRSNGHPFNINVLDNGDLVTSFSARKPGYSNPFTDSSGVFFYDRAAAAWYDRSDPNMRFWTQDVVIDPNDPTQSTWYACVFEGWGTSGIWGTGGLYRTKDKGITWHRIHDDFRVNSCTAMPGNPSVLYFTTETDGLWYTDSAGEPDPQFTQVSEYPFRHPMRVSFNPYRENEVWVTAFGGGIKKGGDSSSGIGNPEEVFPPEIMVYPNPCDDVLHCRLTRPSAVQTITLIDPAGRALRVVETRQAEETGIDLSAFAPGIYFLKVTGDDGRVSDLKVVKQ